MNHTDVIAIYSNESDIVTYNFLDYLSRTIKRTSIEKLSDESLDLEFGNKGISLNTKGLLIELKRFGYNIDEKIKDFDFGGSNE